MADPSEVPSKIYDLSTIDQVTLTPIVRRVFNHQHISVSDWKYSRVYSAGDVGTALSGVFRFSGSARAQDKSLDWSLILKVVGTTATSDNPSEPRYWKREVQAYQSGELEILPGSIAAPRFFGTIEFSERVVGLWLEDLVDEIGPDWTLQEYGLVARHLGEFNGTFLVKQELPSWPWLSRNWARRIVSGEGSKFAQLSRSLDQSLTRRWFIDDDVNGILQLWEERRLFLDVLDRLPQTLLHRDAHRNNLFISQTEDGNDKIVIVDWAFTGIGAIGEELAFLVQGTICFSQVDIAKFHEFDKIVFENYLEGLAAVGWRGDPNLVRLGYAVSSMLVYGLGYGLFQLNESLFPWYEQAFGRPIDEIMDLFAKQNHFLLELVDEVKNLLSVI
jgi:hypothetical protein